MRYRNILGVILGGGVGSRLYPLTKERAKPAVPIGGKYRLVDIPLSNCINSGIERVMVLTQFNSVSLHRHITNTYKFDTFSRGWVQILAAEQTPRSADWYQGTADAVRKQMIEIRAADPEDVIILSGDHLYRMDYRPFLDFHRESGADVTLAVLPVSEQDAPRFGILEADKDNRIIDFFEKPKDKDVLARLRQSGTGEKPFLGSMGVYIFKAGVLEKALEDNDHIDFGKHIIPRLINSHQIYAYPFEGYWEDIGTIRSFFDANIGLTKANPEFSFTASADTPIYTRPRFLPSSRLIGNCRLEEVILSEGCEVEEADLTSCVIGNRSRIGHNSQLINCIMMGADYYEREEDMQINSDNGLPNVGVGKNCRLENVIIDKQVRIGDNVVVRNLPDREDTETDMYTVRDGVVILPKGMVVPSGTVI